MKKFLIITSIFPPTKAVKKFATFSDWQVIVVGDTKTPQNWHYKNVIYLSPKDQEQLGYPIVSHIPWKSYSRKMVGYLYAIKNGADIIADTDDDNIPYDFWGENISFNGTFDTIENKGFSNVYKFFTKKHIWPRGFPLQYVLQVQKNQQLSQKKHAIGVWQFLADGDPDVDAIYRLTNNKRVRFSERQPIVLDKDVICPTDSQNTFFRKECFPLLYLPSFVSFRFTDILRGLLLQPILWQANLSVGFGKATVFQERNPHDYLKDFELEIPIYLYSEKIISSVSQVVKKQNSIKENLLFAYQVLFQEKIVTEEEVNLLKLWLTNF